MDMNPNVEIILFGDFSMPLVLWQYSTEVDSIKILCSLRLDHDFRDTMLSLGLTQVNGIKNIKFK